MFTTCEWNNEPNAVEKLKNGSYRVNRNITTITRDNITLYRGETAIMTAESYAAYLGSQQAEQKREDAIIDDYTQELIEEGLI